VCNDSCTDEVANGGSGEYYLEYPHLDSGVSGLTATETICLRTCPPISKAALELVGITVTNDTTANAKLAKFKYMFET
jgi:hypothetical protein